jgi:hypothetical protein
MSTSAADIAVAAMLGLGPLGVLGVGASVGWDLRHRSELLAAERWMLPVLDLQPVIASAGAVGSLAVLTKPSHATGGIEQVWPNLSCSKGATKSSDRRAAAAAGWSCANAAAGG